MILIAISKNTKKYLDFGILTHAHSPPERRWFAAFALLKHLLTIGQTQCMDREHDSHLNHNRPL